MSTFAVASNTATLSAATVTLPISKTLSVRGPFGPEPLISQSIAPVENHQAKQAVKMGASKYSILPGRLKTNRSWQIMAYDRERIEARQHDANLYDQAKPLDAGHNASRLFDLLQAFIE